MAREHILDAFAKEQFQRRLDAEQQVLRGRAAEFPIAQIALAPAQSQ